MPTQKQFLQAVARKGMGGDTDLAHVTRGDIVIPIEIQTDPLISSGLRGMFIRAGLDKKRFTVGTGKRNRKTGLQAFDVAGGSDAGGAGAGGGTDAGNTGGAGFGGLGIGGVDPSGAAGAAAANAQAAEASAASGAGLNTSGATPGQGSTDVAPGFSTPSSQDLLNFDPSQAQSNVGISRTGEQFGPSLGGTLASLIGYNINPSLTSNTLAGLYGPTQPPGFNTNVVDNALSLAGLFNPALSLASTANTVGKDIFGKSLGSVTQGITGLAAPEASLADLFGGRSIVGDPATGDLATGGPNTGGPDGTSGGESGGGLGNQLGSPLGNQLGPDLGLSPSHDMASLAHLAAAPTTATAAQMMGGGRPAASPAHTIGGISMSDLINQARALGILGI